MSINLAPPPLQIPPDFAGDKFKAAFFSGLINTIYQLWTNVYSIRNTTKILTNDDAVTAGVRIPLNTGKTMMVQAHIVARRTGGTAGSDGDSAYYVLTGCYKNVGGTLTGVSSPNLIGGEDVSEWNVGFSTSGTDVIVTVKGGANTNVTWQATISSYEVGA